MGDKPNTAFLNSTRGTNTAHYILPDSDAPPLTDKQCKLRSSKSRGFLQHPDDWVGKCTHHLYAHMTRSHTCNDDTSDDKDNTPHAFIISVWDSSCFQSDACSSPRPVLQGLIDCSIPSSRPYRSFCGTFGGRICANLWQSITCHGTLIHVLDRSIHHLTFNNEFTPYSGRVCRTLLCLPLTAG